MQIYCFLLDKTDLKGYNKGEESLSKSLDGKSKPCLSSQRAVFCWNYGRTVPLKNAPELPPENFK